MLTVAMDGVEVQSLRFRSHSLSTVRFELVRLEFTNHSVPCRRRTPLRTRSLLCEYVTSTTISVTAAIP